jgi:hypothetical protein
VYQLVNKTLMASRSTVQLWKKKKKMEVSSWVDSSELSTGDSCETLNECRARQYPRVTHVMSYTSTKTQWLLCVSMSVQLEKLWCVRNNCLYKSCFKHNLITKYTDVAITTKLLVATPSLIAESFVIFKTRVCTFQKTYCAPLQRPVS